MTALSEALATPGRVAVAGAPEGRDALAIAEFLNAEPGATAVVVARDDARLAAIADALAFFAPDLPISTFPAWDCLPYDRVSPHPEICAERLRTLCALAANGDQRRGRVVVTTCNAVLQRVPKRATLRDAHMTTRVGALLDLDSLLGFLGRNGYVRSGTVMEPGEFSVRGGIIDLFPAGAEDPVRLDLFGDTVESIRRLDPITQRSGKKRQSLSLVPVSEVILDESSIERFRGEYRALFGAVTGTDPLYEAISEGRRHPGMEHWLPLFHDGLETVLDYMPGATIFLDHLVEESRSERLAAIDDYYQARQVGLDGVSTMATTPYRPVPAAALYLSATDWDKALGPRAVAMFSPYPPAGGAGPIVDLGARRARDFAPERLNKEGGLFDAVRGHLADRVGHGIRTAITCYSAGTRDRLGGLLREHGVPTVRTSESWADVADSRETNAVHMVVLGLEHGFETDGLLLLSEQDVLGDRLFRPTKRRRKAKNFLSNTSALEAGDLVVHVDHGIGRFEGLLTLEVGGAPHDCLKLAYSGGDRLFLPVENIEMLSRYGSGDEATALDKLGGAGWQSRKAKLKKRLRDMAAELIMTAAKRKMRPGQSMRAPAGLYEEFCARFPYLETDDQQLAINDSIKDLASSESMDRLICGDVGFGKTEVALRAAFTAAFSGHQVAVVVPTTLLCRQHFATFRDRFSGLPVRIEQLSRLVSARDAAEARAGLTDGTVDIVIGTHTLLGKSVEFKELGLLIVDEEQRFGVAQKERLKALKADVDVLTLTATPIPRTLQMALTGLRDLSIIATPPVDRLAVRSFVTPYDPVIVREAILREKYRSGQVFYICPRIEDLDKIAAELKRIVPEVSLVIAHGRMAPRALEDVMTAFYDGRVDVLVSTSIIESGLDIPTANTMIVHRADMFGLAQLYQLRGRVGRSKIRAYAYFTAPPDRLLKGAASARLNVLQSLDSLGAGFSLASHDLDIRGAGNLLGEEQSGQVREVGVELYQQLLEEAVTNAKRAESGDKAAVEERWSPQITVGTAVMIPESYVVDLPTRLDLYRRLADLDNDEEIDAFAAELVDRFGTMPPEAAALLTVTRIKIACRLAGVQKVDAGPKGLVVGFRNNNFAAPEKLIGLISSSPERLKLRPDHRLVVTQRWPDPDQRMAGVRAFVQALAEMVA